MRRAAVERVQSLFAKYLLKSDVLDALRAENSLSAPFRAAAFEIAERPHRKCLGALRRGDDRHLTARWSARPLPLGRAAARGCLQGCRR